MILAVITLYAFFLQKHKKKGKAEVFNFSAIHLIHDPQGKKLACVQITV